MQVEVFDLTKPDLYEPSCGDLTSSTPFLVLMTICSKTFLMSASGSNKLTSILNRMSMKLHSKLGGFLSIKTETFQRL